MKIIITIDAKFGSKFREEYAPETLKAMVIAWAESEKNFNKKTKLEYEFKKVFTNQSTN